ncbi:MAG: nucleotidyltransferase family protein [Gammaproteobacteria bacterium]|nr:nucleotidyltransferase family protein [Gammaproteobacteria bacterium]
MSLLTDVLGEPAVVRDWGAAEWNALLPLARAARLLGRCLALFEERGLTDALPARLLDQLHGARAQTRYVQGQALREWRQVAATLHAADIDVMPLKGVAYLLAGLPPAGWRNLSDVDLLVRPDAVDAAEAALKQAGWRASGELDSYDEHYYRDWMHEVPPLVHARRDMEVDLHHNLAPPVSRVRIDAALLWRAAVTAPGPDGVPLTLPAPTDLLLHNAIHLFMNDELRGGLRDIVDFRDLFVHFSAADTDFATQLVRRAEQLGCARALYYAASAAQRLIGLSLPGDVVAGIRRHAPAPPVDALMRWLIDRLLAPVRPGTAAAAIAERALFVRSHWIRMPPRLLLRHLAHKWLKRRKPPLPATELPG